MNTDKTQKFWEKRANQPITPDKAREMIESTAGFFKVLADWDRQAQDADPAGGEGVVAGDNEGDCGDKADKT